jgi:hypothetical protein
MRALRLAKPVDNRAGSRLIRTASDLQLHGDHDANTRSPQFVESGHWSVASANVRLRVLLTQLLRISFLAPDIIISIVKVISGRHSPDDVCCVSLIFR